MQPLALAIIGISGPSSAYALAISEHTISEDCSVSASSSSQSTSTVDAEDVENAPSSRIMLSLLLPGHGS